MRIRYFAFLSCIVIGLAVSGCAGPSEEAPADKTPSSTPAAAEEIMDSEISTIESDMSELDALLAEMDEMQDISFTELEGLSF